MKRILVFATIAILLLPFSGCTVTKDLKTGQTVGSVSVTADDLIRVGQFVHDYNKQEGFKK